MVTNMAVGIGTNSKIRRVRRTSIRSHGKIRTKSHGTKIRSPSTVTRTPSPKMLV